MYLRVSLAVLSILTSGVTFAQQAIVIAEPQAGMVLDRLSGHAKSPRKYFKTSQEYVEKVIPILKRRVETSKDGSGNPLLSFDKYGLQFIGRLEDQNEFVLVSGFCNVSEILNGADPKINPVAYKGGGGCFFSAKYSMNPITEIEFWVNSRE